MKKAMEVAEKFVMEKLGVGKVQLKAGEVKPVVETVEKVEPKKGGRKERKEKVAGGGGAVMKCNPQSVAALKVLVAAKYSGMNVKVEKSDTFCLGDDKVSGLTDSGAAALYVCDKQMSGSTVADKAKVLEWLFYSSGDLHHAVAGWVAPTQSSVDSCNPSTVMAREYQPGGFVSGHQSLARIHQGLPSGHGSQDQAETFGEVSHQDCDCRHW